MPWHAKRPPGASDRANEVGPTGSTAGHWSALEPSWLVGRLRLGVGHASTVRPDPSTLGVVGERGSRHEGPKAWLRRLSLLAKCYPTV
jgi:hypothetical protein